MEEFFFKGFSKTFLSSKYSYDSPELVEKHSLGQLSEMASLYNHPFSIMLESRMWGSTILPVLVASQLNNPNSIFRILEFGGGACKQFIEIIKATKNQNNIFYHNVELEAYVNFCQPYLEHILKDESLISRIKMTGYIPKYEYFDIVSCTSSLQYVEDWKDVVKSCLTCNPLFFVVINTPFNDKITYSRFQYNLKPLVIPQWVFGIDEFDNFIGKLGYNKVFYSNHQLNYPTLDTPENSTTTFSACIFKKRVLPS